MDSGDHVALGEFRDVASDGHLAHAEGVGEVADADRSAAAQFVEQSLAPLDVEEPVCCHVAPLSGTEPPMAWRAGVAARRSGYLASQLRITAGPSVRVRAASR